jgi:hypothetical protein
MRAQSLLAAAVLLCSLANCLPHVENAPRNVDSVAQVDAADEEPDLLTSDAGGPSKGGNRSSSSGAAPTRNQGGGNSGGQRSGSGEGERSNPPAEAPVRNILLFSIG